MAQLPLTRNPFKLIQTVTPLDIIRYSGLEPERKRIALVSRCLGAKGDFFFDLFDYIGAPELAGGDHAVGADYLRDLASVHERVCGRRSVTSLARWILPFLGLESVDRSRSAEWQFHRLRATNDD